MPIVDTQQFTNYHPLSLDRPHSRSALCYVTTKRSFHRVAPTFPQSIRLLEEPRLTFQWLLSSIKPISAFCTKVPMDLSLKRPKHT